MHPVFRGTRFQFIDIRPNKLKQQKTPFPSYDSNFIKYDADVTLYKFIIATTKLAKQPSLIFG